MQRYDFFFRQLVEEGDLDAAFQAAEDAINRLLPDLGFVGVAVGADVAQQGSPNLTVQVSGPAVAYDQTGQRIAFAATQNVNCAVDESSNSTSVAAPANSKWLSLFLEFTRTLSDPQLDGNATTVYYNRAESFRINVVQGGEAAVPTRPALRSNQILIADIQIAYGTTQITNAMISTTRRQNAFNITDSPRSITAKTALGALAILLGYYNDHVDGTGDRHPATAVDYAGGAAWADGTTNPARTVEAQIDAMISTLASAGAGVSGLRRIGGEVPTPQWADSTQLGGGIITTAYDAIYALINDLRTTTTSISGAGKIGIDALSSWADGSTNSSGSLRTVLNTIVTGLASTSAASGAGKIGIDALGNWADGTTNPSGTLRARLNTIISVLAATTASNSGAHKIGIDARSNWLDAVTNPATNTAAAVAKIITDLISTTSSSSGARKIGIEQLAATWADATTVASGSVYAAVNAIVSVLAATTVSNSGAHKLGIDALVSWADSTTNPATTVRAAINKIVFDLAASTGTAKVGGAAMTANGSSTIAAGTLAAQLTNLLNTLEARADDAFLESVLSLRWAQNGSSNNVGVRDVAWVNNGADNANYVFLTEPVAGYAKVDYSPYLNSNASGGFNPSTSMTQGYGIYGSSVANMAAACGKNSVLAAQIGYTTGNQSAGTWNNGTITGTGFDAANAVFNDVVILTTGRVVACGSKNTTGANGGVAYSTTLPTFASATVPASRGTMNAIAAKPDNSILVAVGNSGHVIYSTDQGATWSSGTSGTANALRGVCWNAAKGYFYAVGDSGTMIRSTDGNTWASVSLGTTLSSWPRTFNILGIAADHRGRMLFAIQEATGSLLAYVVATVDGSTFSRPARPDFSVTAGFAPKANQAVRFVAGRFVIPQPSSFKVSYYSDTIRGLPDSSADA